MKISKVQTQDFDTQLLREELKKGCLNHFWIFWENNKKLFYRICLKYSKGSVDEAEDALGDAMLKVVDILPKHIERIVNIRSWIIRLINNHCIDVYRKKNQYKFNGEDIEEINEEKHLFIYQSSDPELEIISKINSEFTQKLLGKIPQKLRDVFIYRYYDEMSYEEIALRFSVSPECIRKRIQRGKEQLQKLIKVEKANRCLSQHHKSRSKSLTSLQKSHIDNSNILTNQEMHIAPQFMRSGKVTFSGVSLDVYVTLNEKPVGEELKEKVLLAYIKKYPTGWKKRLELANLLYGISRWKEAVEQYKIVLKRNHRLLLPYLMLADIAKNLHNDDEAKEFYHLALKRTNSLSTQRHIMALLFLLEKDFPNAIKELKQASTEKADSTVHWQKLGEVYKYLGFPDQASSCFHEVLRIHPSNILAMRGRAEELMKIGQRLEAIKLAEDILAFDKENIPALKLLVDDYCKRQVFVGGNEGETYGMIQTMQKHAPDHAGVHESTAYYYLTLGKEENGLRILEEFTRSHPTNPFGWLNYAVWLYQRRNVIEARNAILKAWHLYKDAPEIYSITCEILMADNQIGTLRTVIDDMLKRFGFLWCVWVIAGQAFAGKLQNNRKAHECAMKVLWLQRHFPHAWYQAGFIFAEISRPDFAVRALEKGWELSKGNEVSAESICSAIWLGGYYKSKGEKEKSIDWFSQAKRILYKITKKEPSMGFFLFGVFMEKNNKNKMAYKAYKKSLKYNTSAALKERAISACARVGDRKESFRNKEINHEEHREKQKNIE